MLDQHVLMGLAKDFKLGFIYVINMCIEFVETCKACVLTRSSCDIDLVQPK